jgi:hypothetical protein
MSNKNNQHNAHSTCIDEILLTRQNKLILALLDRFRNDLNKNL